MRNRAALLALILMVLPSASVSAQTSPIPSESGRTHFETGARAYDVGDYALAAREFRAAYEASGHPDLLYNIYAASERLGELEEARDALSAFLRDAEVDSERRAALEQRLARLEARIDEGATEPEAEPPPPPLAPPAVAPPVAPAALAPVDEGPSTASIALLSTSGALLVSFGIFAVLSNVEDGRLDDRCGVVCTDDEVVRLRTFNGLADASWIGATAVGALGLTLLLVHRPDRAGEAAGASVALAPFAVRRGGGLALEGRF